jgi:UDP-2,4-diacetamido-2,4,6-trideoxy-beta-L-altropyranose hydrolase
MKKVVFAVAWGPSIGMGHLVRSTRIAKVLRKFGLESALIGPANASIDDRYKAVYDKHYPDLSLPGFDSWQELLRSGPHAEADFLVVDVPLELYGGHEPLLEAGRSWLQFDPGLPQLLGGKIIVNTRPGIQRAELSSRVQRDDAVVLAGAEFAPLGDSFHDVSRPIGDGLVRRLLVSFGGGDDRGGIELVLTNLGNLFTRLEKVVLLVGPQNPNLEEIRKLINEHEFRDYIELQANPTDVAEVYASCDLALVAGGTSTYELAYLGIPMILISIAANQVNQCEAWQKAGAAIYLGRLESNGLGEVMRSNAELLFGNAELVRCMSYAGTGLVTGLGAQKIAREIAKEVAKNSR